jgi:hypothetical protein
MVSKMYFQRLIRINYVFYVAMCLIKKKRVPWSHRYNYAKTRPQKCRNWDTFPKIAQQALLHLYHHKRKKHELKNIF